VDQYTIGFEAIERVCADYGPDRVAEICGIARDDLETAAHWIGTTPRMVSTALMGFYQSTEATAAVPSRKWLKFGVV